MIDKIIGNYRITAELAQGGMGAVYRGRHQNLPREVVVKVILLSSFPQRDQAHLKARFVREAYVQSQLDHPNIVRVYEFFTTEENYYLVMEFIDGMSLRQLVQRRGALPPKHAVPLLKQALSALSYAHGFSYEDEAGQRLSGITHRDIKPANILLDGKGRLKITDFGIVKLAGESGMTRTGFNPGTVEYMSPEQIRGLVVDARSDIYSLGVTFYEALSGRLPFPPSDTGSEYEVMRGHTELAPPPLRAVKADVPARLADLVMRSLEKDPAQRFQSAEEWLNAIVAYENDPAATSEIPMSQETKGTPVHSLTETLEAEGTERLTERIEREVQETSLMPGRETLVENRRDSSPMKDVLETRVSPVQNSSAQAPSGAPQEIEPNSASRFSGARSVPSGAKSSFNFKALIALVVAVVLIVAAIELYLILVHNRAVEQRNSNAVDAPVGATTSGSPATASVSERPSGQIDEKLRLAFEAEQAERYQDSIRLYQQFLQANPQSPDAGTILRKIEVMKEVNGHLEMAKVWMDQGDFAEAKKDYAAAVKLRPESKLAAAGLAKASKQ